MSQESLVYRYERKFFIPHMSEQEIASWLKRSTAFFTEVFHKRKINNVYYDDCEFNSYINTLEGMKNRYKVRMRWYGETDIEESDRQLEVKSKAGDLISKKLYFFKKFPQDRVYCCPQIFRDLNGTKLSRDIAAFPGYRPSVLNSYERSYFLSRDRKIRATIDSRLAFRFLSSNLSPKKRVSLHNISPLILELKYNPDDDERARRIIQHIPFKISKFSKYRVGLETFKGTE